MQVEVLDFLIIAAIILLMFVPVWNASYGRKVFQSTAEAEKSSPAEQ